MSESIDARTAHARLRAALKTLRDAERNAVALFAEILKRRLYRDLGYADIRIYATEALGFSRSKTYEFIRLAEALERLPRLKQSVARGDVPWTKAREVAKVATPRTEKKWIAIAEKSSRRELATQVVQSRARRDAAARDARRNQLPLSPASADSPPPPPAPPVETLTLRLDPLRRARFDALVEKLMKRHHRTHEDVLLLALETLLAAAAATVVSKSRGHALQKSRGHEFAPDPNPEPRNSRGHGLAPDPNPQSRHSRGYGLAPGPNPQSRHSRGHGLAPGPNPQPRADDEGKCAPPTSQCASPQSSNRLDAHSPYQIIIHQCPTCGSKTVGASRQPLTAAQAAQVECDTRILEPGERNRASIAPSRRREVLQRDGRHCRVRGCGATGFLEIHHIERRADGGDNSAANLVTLCSRCHGLVHERDGRLPRLRPVASETEARTATANPRTEGGDRTPRSPAGSDP